MARRKAKRWKPLIERLLGKQTGMEGCEALLERDEYLIAKGDLQKQGRLRRGIGGRDE